MRVALIVGHIGKGTGATFENRDEWSIARDDARRLYMSLMNHDDIVPSYFEINRDELRWSILGDLLNDKSDDSIKANWVRTVRADCVIDFHYNKFKDASVSGHLIVAPEMNRFATCIYAALEMLPNRHRDPIVNNGFRLFQRLENDGIPSVIIEPAFIFEPAAGDKSFHVQLVDALKWGLERYARDDLDVSMNGG